MDIDPDLLLYLSLLFFGIAFIYSSVGLGGGSSYTALMAIFGLNTVAIPLVSLILNLTVTLIGSYHFIKNRHGRVRIILPFLLTSIPMAYWGGSLEIPAEIFYLILWLSLILVAVRIYFWENPALRLSIQPGGKIILCLLIGALLGLVAGIVGIGGGIYLVPAIIILNLGSPKEAAACGAIFIWINSLSGLLARLHNHPLTITDYLPLILAVLFGGFLGSSMGATRLPPSTMEKILGGVILVAIAFLTRTILLRFIL